MRIEDQVNENAFAKKNTELRVRRASLQLELDVLDRSKEENAHLGDSMYRGVRHLSADGNRLRAQDTPSLCTSSVPYGDDTLRVEQALAELVPNAHQAVKFWLYWAGTLEIEAK